MKALVTGGTGFVGSNIARQLMKDGWDVTVTGNKNEQALPGIKNQIIEGDLGKIDWQKLGRFDAIFHQAAITDTLITDESEMMRVNFEESKRLFQYAAETGCPKVAYASSTAVYGAGKTPYKETDEAVPLNAYGRSKLRLDGYALKFASENPGTVFIGLRYCNVYGPGEAHKGKMASMPYQLAQQMKTRNPKLFKWGEQERDYIFVKDVVRANLLAAEAKSSCVINCGGGRAVTFNRIFELLEGISGFGRKIEYIDNPYAKSYQEHTECDMSLAHKMIGFKPQISIENGIEEYYKSGMLF